MSMTELNLLVLSPPLGIEACGRLYLLLWVVVDVVLKCHRRRYLGFTRDRLLCCAGIGWNLRCRRGSGAEGPDERIPGARKPAGDPDIAQLTSMEEPERDT